MAGSLRVVAFIVFVAVFIGGIVAGNTYQVGEYSFRQHFNVLLAIGIWVVGSIPAFILLGISDILDELTILNKNFIHIFSPEKEDDDKNEDA